MKKQNKLLKNNPLDEFRESKKKVKIIIIII